MGCRWLWFNSSTCSAPFLLTLPASNGSDPWTLFLLGNDDQVCDVLFLFFFFCYGPQASITSCVQYTGHNWPESGSVIKAFARPLPHCCDYSPLCLYVYLHVTPARYHFSGFEKCGALGSLALRSTISHSIRLGVLALVQIFLC